MTAARPDTKLEGRAITACLMVVIAAPAVAPAPALACSAIAPFGVVIVLG